MPVNHDRLLTELEEDIDHTELRFKCPFCDREADYAGGCRHFVFSFEMINFQYMVVDKDFRNRALDHLRGLGFILDELPCPLEPWAEDREGNQMPSLPKVISGVRLVGYKYSAPHGHGSWGVIVGFERKDR